MDSVGSFAASTSVVEDFFLQRNSTFIQATARIQLKSLNQATSIGGGRFLGKKNSSTSKLRIQFGKCVSYHIGLLFNPTKTTKTKLHS